MGLDEEIVILNPYDITCLEDDFTNDKINAEEDK
jgi:hypothetical protein